MKKNTRQNSVHVLASSGRLRDLALALRIDEQVDRLDDSGRTPLMIASENGRTHTVRLLLERGANFEIRSREGQTALMLAARAGRFGVVKHLLRAGSDALAVDKCGLTALDSALEGGDYPEIISVLGVLSPKLERRGKDNLTPLLRAVRSGRAKSTAVLLTLGANANAKVRGRTALQIAMSTRDRNLIRTMQIVLRHRIS
jgi:uncharacterized protein